MANGLPVLSCNRVGHEPSPLGASGIQFWGNSHVLGPQGEFIAAPMEGGALVPWLLERGDELHALWAGEHPRTLPVQSARPI